MFQISGFRVEGVVNLVTINDYKTESVHCWGLMNSATK